jgi:hypothetical protein
VTVELAASENMMMMRRRRRTRRTRRRHLDPARILQRILIGKIHGRNRMKVLKSSFATKIFFILMFQLYERKLKKGFNA